MSPTPLEGLESGLVQSSPPPNAATTTRHKRHVAAMSPVVTITEATYYLSCRVGLAEDEPQRVASGLLHLVLLDE